MKTLITLLAALGLGSLGLFGSDVSPDAAPLEESNVRCTAEPTENGRCRITCTNDDGETCEVVVDCETIDDCRDVDPADGCAPGSCPS